MRTQVAIIGGSVAGMRAAMACSAAGVRWLLLSREGTLGESCSSTRTGGFTLDGRLPVVAGDEAEWVAWDESILGLLGPVAPLLVRVRHGGAWHEQSASLARRIAARLGIVGRFLGGTAPAPRHGAAVDSLLAALGMDTGRAGSASAAAASWRRPAPRPALLDGGIGRLVDHLAPHLPLVDPEPADREQVLCGLLLDHPVDAITVDAHGIEACAGEERIRADAVILATEATGAAETGSLQPWRTLHYSIPPRKVPRPLAGGALVVSDEPGPIHHALMVSDLSPRSAPEGRCLLAITTLHEEVVNLGPVGADRAIRSQLCGWFGPAALAGWRMVGSSVFAGPRVSGAHSNGEPVPEARPVTQVIPVTRGDRIFSCPAASLTGPLVWQVQVGRLAAEAAIGSLQAPHPLPASRQ